MTLNPRINPDKFFAHLKKAKLAALLLDYDGTLAPFRIKREKAWPYSGVRQILESIIDSTDTRVVVISGRWTKDLIPLLGLRRLPEIWGSYGHERLTPDGNYKLIDPEPQITGGLDEAVRQAQSAGFANMVERKPASVALHWRGIKPTRRNTMRNNIEKVWSTIAESSGLAIREFDGGIELRHPAQHKGGVVRTVLSEMGTDVGTAYLGDDLTDEDAFYAIRGRGVGILVRREIRQTAADLWLKPPEELRKFLTRWAESRADNR